MRHRTFFTIRHWLICGLLAVLLSACGTQQRELPTLVRFASSTPLAVASQPAQVAQQATNPSRATLSATFTPTNTPTTTPTLTLTITPSVTPSATITETITPTPTPLPTIDPNRRPLLGLLEAARQATVLPTDFVVPNFGNGGAPPVAPSATPPGYINIPGVEAGSTPTPARAIRTACAYYPAGNFAGIYLNNPDIAAQLGCLPAPPDIISSSAAWQPFENGLMIWLQTENRIYVFNDVTDTYTAYNDTFVEGADPNDTTEAPPAGLVAPRRGFLKIWSQQPGIRAGLGWATAAEQATTVTIQQFPNGRMISLPARGDTLVLIGESTGIWQSFSGTF